MFWVARLRRVNPPLDPKPFPPGVPAPLVSVIVPARNEERNIENCLSHLFRQTYPNFEIVVVDDRSTDATPLLLKALAQHSPVPLKIVRIEKLPPGWTGKTHAMTAGSYAAKGQWLLFTDADTTHGPLSVSTAVQEAVDDGIDLLTLAPETECRTFWEKTVQPLAVSSLALWFRTDRLNDDDAPVLANGQYLLIARAAYEAAGGSESVKTEVVEDVAFAKKMRAEGRRVRFLNGTRLYRTRMYSSLAEIRRGWTRIFTFLFDKNLPAVLHKIFLFLFFSLFPFVVPFLGVSTEVRFAAAAVCVLILSIRCAGNRTAKTDPAYGLLHPLGSLIMVWILLECAYRIVFRKPSEWRGQLHA